MDAEDWEQLQPIGGCIPTPQTKVRSQQCNIHDRIRYRENDALRVHCVVCWRLSGAVTEHAAARQRFNAHDVHARLRDAFCPFDTSNKRVNNEL